MTNALQIRGGEIQKILLIALCFNLLAWTLKFLWGYWTQSISMQADGLHSLLDAGSSALGFLGILMASQPPNARHPYGHSKFETMAAIGIAVFIFIGCYEIVTGSVDRFWTKGGGGGLKPTPTSYIIMLAAMAANILLSRWEARMAQALASDILRADALHTRSDFYASLSVVVSFLGAEAGYPLLDPIAALAIAAVIGRAGVKILIDSTRVLTDSSQIDSAEVAAFVSRIDGVETCHAVRTRGSRSVVYMDLHIHVAPEMKMEVAHKLAHRVEAEIMNRFKEVSEVVVHLEPHLTDLEND